MDGIYLNERIDDLQYCGLRIIQDTEHFCFGVDTVLLAGFAGARIHDRICDLGTGGGILPLLISARVRSTQFDAVEINPEMAARAERSVRMNHLENRIFVHNRDMMDVRAFLPSAAYDLVICNPPYFRNTGWQPPPREDKLLSKTDAACTIADVSNAARWLLRNGGHLAVVFPAVRMLEAMDAMRAARIQPKRFRLVSSYIGKAPFICLVEGVMNAKPSLHPMSPLILYEADGGYTAELREIYHLDEPAAGGKSVQHISRYQAL